MGSGLDDWIYWHFFTITVNYENSTINVCPRLAPFLAWLRVSSFLLVYESVTCSASVVLRLTPHSWTLNYWTAFWIPLRMNLWLNWIESESESYVTTDGQPASLSWNKAPIWGLRPDLYYLCDSCGFVGLGRPLWREDGSVDCTCYWPSPGQSFSGPSPVGLVALFYCLRFETSLFVASYDSQGHGGGNRPRLHTGMNELSFITSGGPNSGHHNEQLIVISPFLRECLC
jgi:hypothetical protein